MFGGDTESAVLYGVECSGNETDLLSCALSFTGVCPDHTTGVVCQGIHPLSLSFSLIILMYDL